jgi:hypothetical protein
MLVIVAADLFFAHGQALLQLAQQVALQDKLGEDAELQGKAGISIQTLLARPFGQQKELAILAAHRSLKRASGEVRIRREQAIQRHRIGAEKALDLFVRHVRVGMAIAISRGQERELLDLHLSGDFGSSQQSEPSCFLGHRERLSKLLGELSSAFWRGEEGASRFGHAFQQRLDIGR